MADNGNFRKEFIVASGFCQSTMAETLWNVSGLGFKVAIAGSQPHKEKVGKAGQRAEEERPTDKGLPVMFCFCH